MYQRLRFSSEYVTSIDVTANSPKIVRGFNEAIIPPSSHAVFSIRPDTIYISSARAAADTESIGGFSR
jgi:hypothetical protein